MLVSTSELQTSDRRPKRSCFNVGALRKFHVIEGQNARDQVTFFAFHSFLVEVQTNAGYIWPSMRKSTLEIKIEGSSCRLWHDQT